MDPLACLLMGIDAFADGDREEAEFHLEDFYGWHRRGGFVTPELWAQADYLANLLSMEQI